MILLLLLRKKLLMSTDDCETLNRIHYNILSDVYNLWVELAAGGRMQVPIRVYSVTVDVISQLGVRNSPSVYMRHVRLYTFSFYIIIRQKKKMLPPFLHIQTNLISCKILFILLFSFMFRLCSYDCTISCYMLDKRIFVI